MTDARLKPAPAQGHGLTSRVTDKVYNDLATGKPVERVVAIVELDPVEHGEKRTADGTVRWVRFEVAKVEPALDSHTAEVLRHQMQDSWDARHGSQVLPLDWSAKNEVERGSFLVSLIDDWASENGHDEQAVRAMWADYFGGPEYAFPDYRKAPLLRLEEFTKAKGVLPEDVDATADIDSSDDDDEDDEPDDEPDDAAELDDSDDDSTVVAFSSK